MPPSRLRPQTALSRIALVLAISPASACSLYFDHSITGGDDGPIPPDCCIGSIEEPPPPDTLGDECVPHGPAFQFAICEDDVCHIDPSCCGEAWTERCVQLADERCPSVDCQAVPTFADDGGIAYAVPSGASWVGASRDTGDATVTSVAWAEGLLATAGDCTARVFQSWTGSLQPAYASPGCHRYTRAGWADIDGDHQLDAVFAGDGGATWVRGPTFQSGGTIVASLEGAVTDLVITDVDGDGRVDAIATFADRPARLYHRQPDGAFVADLAWTSALSGHTRALACDVAGDGATELVLGGPAGVEIVPRGGAPARVAAIPDATDLACGLLFGGTRQQIVAISADGTLRVVDGDGTVRATASVPPGSHVAVGGRDLYVSVPGGGDTPFLVLRNGGGTFVPETAIDPAPDHSAGAVTAIDVRSMLP